MTNRFLIQVNNQILTVLSCLMLFLLSVDTVFAQMPQQLPPGSRENYVDYKDASISDEFNSHTLDFSKWGRRNTGGYLITNYVTDSSLVKMERQVTNDGAATRYVSFKATVDNGSPKTAGIVSKATGFYGFYVVKFRYRGFDSLKLESNRTIWHPSIWGARLDNIDGVDRSTGPSNFWLELDMMEWVTHKNGWGSHTVARLIDSHGKNRIVSTKKDEKARMLEVTKRADSTWQTIGLEYSPEHLKIWEWSAGRWKHIGDRVVEFKEDESVPVENLYTRSTIGKKSATPVFWILGNVVSRFLYEKIENGTSTYGKDDLSFDIDFFRYYRHVDAVNLDWPWENEMENGSAEIQKDMSENQKIENPDEMIDLILAPQKPFKGQIFLLNDWDGGDKDNQNVAEELNRNSRIKKEVISLSDLPNRIPKKVKVEGLVKDANVLAKASKQGKVAIAMGAHSRHALAWLTKLPASEYNYKNIVLVTHSNWNELDGRKGYERNKKAGDHELGDTHGEDLRRGLYLSLAKISDLGVLIWEIPRTDMGPGGWGGKVSTPEGEAGIKSLDISDLGIVYYLKTGNIEATRTQRNKYISDVMKKPSSLTELNRDLIVRYWDHNREIPGKKEDYLD